MNFIQAPETLVSEIVSLVRKDLGAVAAFRLVAQVEVLPRTRYVTMMVERMRMMMRLAMTMRMGEGLDNVIAFGLLARVKALPETR